LIKSRCGIVAALAFLFCCSQSEAGDGKNAKLMADRPEAQGPEWVLYEDRNEDLDIVSFNQAGDSDGTYKVCQSEDGAVGRLHTVMGRFTIESVTCRTDSGDHNMGFYVLQLAEGADEEMEALRGYSDCLEAGLGFLSHQFKQINVGSDRLTCFGPLGVRLFGLLKSLPG
jgi:hypothetical protein